jgi:KDO2-lipid IV(A) lauroyltransferase
MPLDMASAVGGFIGRSIGPRLGARKKVLRNLRRALPELNEQAYTDILTGMWDNLGRVMAEYPHLDKMDNSRVRISGADHVRPYVENGKPFILVSGHFANWEILPVSAAKMGLELQLVYRHANNPYADDLLKYARTPMGNRLARKGVEGARSVHGALRRGQAIGMLVDQKHNRGMAVPFFGMPAMTATAVAELALRYNAPVFMVRLQRLTGANFAVDLMPALPIDPLARHEDESSIRTILGTINTVLEQWVRARPEQWLWLHRRWPD